MLKGAFGIPDDESMGGIIDSDDTGVVRLGGKNQIGRRCLRHFESSDFFATRKLSE